MESTNSKRLGTVCYLGLILIIVGYVSFSNHRDIGNLITVVGVLMIIVEKVRKLLIQEASEKIS